MAEFTKERIIEELKASTQNASGMFEISEDTICELMSMLTNAAPQLPQPAVMKLPVQHWEELCRQNPEMSIGDAIMRAAWWNHCAAMLQGAEPVSQRDELPMDYLQGHKDGLEWAARLAEANHPQTGDWLYDDPLDLAKAIRKGPDMPVEPVLKLTFREALAAIRNLGPIDAGKIQAERDALNEPDVPDGYALVPVEPTAEMVAAAMLSDDVLFDQDDDTMFRVQHGVIWRAMLAAAPDFREISNSSTKHFRENAETSTKCWCHTCRPVTMTDARFVVCPDCGNKRCPHANDHRNACTGSNEPGQEGSAYPAAQHQEVATDNATQQFMSLGLIVTSDERKMELTRCSKHPETELQVHPLEQLMSYPPQPVMYCPLCRPSVAEWVEFDKQLRQWKEVK